MSHKKKSPEFYEYYPKLFHDYFPDIDKVTIDLLSKAGFYFYQSILQLDAVIDNQENHRIFNVLDLQENAIKILSTIYEDGNNFWNLCVNKKKRVSQGNIIRKKPLE